MFSLSLSVSFQQGCGAIEELPVPFSKHRKISITSKVKFHAKLFDL